MRRSIARALAVAMLFGSLPPTVWGKESPLVDRKSTSTSTPVSSDQIQNLPTGRSYADLAKLTPGVSDHKTSPEDSVNWSSPLAPHPSDSGPSPEAVEQIQVAKGAGSAVYGSDAIQGVMNFIARQPEWPGEAAGINGLVLATGKSKGKEKTAVVYGFDGVPIASFTANNIKQQPDQAIGALNYGCMLTSGKSQIYREDRLTSGKTELDRQLTSGKDQVYREDRVRGSVSSGGLVTPGGGPGIDYLPQSYRLSPDLRWTLSPDFKKWTSGGGMQQIDAPMAPTPQQTTPNQNAPAPKKDTGTVTDADIDHGMGKLNQAQRDALDQYGLTPKKPHQAPPQPSGGTAPTQAPTESVLDDLNTNTMPLKDHPAPRGEPRVTENKDGSSTRTWPDGTTETSYPDGRQTATFSDGSTFTRGADGTMVDTLPDGTRVTRDNTGAETGRQPSRPQQPQQPTQPQPSQGGSGSATGAVNDQTIIDATKKQKPAVQDAINQFLTPQGQQQTQPKSAPSEKKKSKASKNISAKPRAESDEATRSVKTWTAEAQQSSASIAEDASRMSAPWWPQIREAAQGMSQIVSETPVTSDGFLHVASPAADNAPLGAPPTKYRMTSVSTTDAEGNTVTIAKQPNGTTTRTLTDPSGHTISQAEVQPIPPTKVQPPRVRTSASTTDADGNTIKIEKQADGTTTRTVTAPDGHIISSGPITPEPPTKVPPRTPGTSGSATDADGNTVTIKKNADGTTTRTVTAPDGHQISSNTVAPEPPTKVPPRAPGTSASTTDADGNTVTIKKTPDGTTTRTVTTPDGKTISSEPVTPPPPTKVPPRTPGTSASTTDADGNTITIKKNPDGTTTRTVTDPSGRQISSDTRPPEPPTKVPPRKGPRTSASTTDANGNTVTIEKNADGTTTRTVTDPNGREISKGPVEPIPPTKAPPRQPGRTSASTTDADGNTVNIEKQADGSTIKTVTDPNGKIINRHVVDPPPPTLPKPAKPTASAKKGGKSTGAVVDDRAVIDAAARLVGQAALGGNEQAANLLGGISPFLSEAGKEAVVNRAVEHATGEPTHSVLDEFDGNVPLHDEPKGEPTISNQPNGDHLRTWPDGTREVTHPDGSQEVEFPDGSRFARRPDGWTIDMAPDGCWIVRDPYDYEVDSGELKDLYDEAPPAKPLLPLGPRPHLGGSWHTADGEWPYQDEGPSRKPLIGSGLRVGDTIYWSNGYQERVPPMTMPRGWMPENVMVLPYGCSSRDKPARLNDIGLMFNGTLPRGPGIYWSERVIGLNVEGKSKPQPTPQVTPNDPLYFHPGPGKTKDGKPMASDQWGLQAVGYTPQAQADSAWNQVDPDQPNVVVAVIDSGLDTSHPDGPAHLWTNSREIPDNHLDDDHDGYVDDVHGWNFVEENHDLTDVKGHGTLVAGIIAAKRHNGAGIAGINPGAQIMVLKVADEYGKANSLNVYRALHYAVDHGARVINLSLGGEGLTQLDQLAVNYAHGRGAVVVVAAGNESADVSGYSLPRLRRALTVAMMRMDGSRHVLSNQGVNVALIAPGEEIYSLHSKDAEWPGPPTARERLYRPATGTSFAAPIVAGTASLILAKYPGLPNFLVEDRLIDSAKRFAADGWEPGTGWGLLNASQALTMPLDQAITVLPTEVVVRGGKKSVSSVDVFGIVRGAFTGYQVELGKGRDPKEWQPLGSVETEPVNYGLLSQIPGDRLRGSREWTVRVTATGKDGAKKVARIPIAL